MYLCYWNAVSSMAGKEEETELLYIDLSELSGRVNIAGTQIVVKVTLPTCPGNPKSQ